MEDSSTRGQERLASVFISALLAAAVLTASLWIWWELRRTSWDFAVSIVPGWHVPILAWYAVAFILVGGIVLAFLLRAASGGAEGEERR